MGYYLFQKKGFVGEEDSGESFLYVSSTMERGGFCGSSISWVLLCWLQLLLASVLDVFILSSFFFFVL